MGGTIGRARWDLQPPRPSGGAPVRGPARGPFGTPQARSSGGISVFVAFGRIPPSSRTGAGCAGASWPRGSGGMGNDPRRLPAVPASVAAGFAAFGQIPILPAAGSGGCRGPASAAPPRRGARPADARLRLRRRRTTAAFAAFGQNRSPAPARPGGCRGPAFAAPRGASRRCAALAASDGGGFCRFRTKRSSLMAAWDRGLRGARKASRNINLYAARCPGASAAGGAPVWPPGCSAEGRL